MNTRYASLLLLSALSFQLKAARISDLEYASYIALPPASPEMPPPPSNDMCSSVTPASLAVGGSLTFTGDNTGATFAGDAVSGPIFDVGLPCVWHGFTTTECANVTIDLCGTTPVWTSVYHFLTTTCPADANVVNATDFNNSDCVDGSQSIHFIALPAGTYYIPVLLNVFAEFGPYTMHVGAASCGGGVPANDLCSSVTPQALAVGTPINFSGNNTNATLAGDAVAGTLIDQVGLPCVWHSFTTTECTNVTMDLCGATPAWTNVYHLLATTCPADNNLINANDFNTTDCVDGNQTIHYNALPAGTYYVPIIYDVFSQYGAYTMHVSAVACGGGVPVNDLCSSVTPQALAINATINFSGNNTNATLAGDAVPGTLIDQVGLPCVWHAFTTTECADVTMDLCGATPAWTNVYHLLATTCPADNNLINANDFNTTTCVDGNQTIHYIGLPAGTYYVPLLYDAFGQNGAYTMHVHAGLCANAPPVNDLCTSVTAVTIAMGTTTTFTGNSINATSTGDAVPGTLIDQVGLPNVWHEFTIAECADVTVNYCATDTNFHTVWSILATTCPANNNLVPATSSDSTSCANGNQTNFYNNLPAGTYYLPVLMNPFNNTVGPYSIDVQAVVCDSSSCDGGLVSVTGDGTDRKSVV